MDKVQQEVDRLFKNHFGQLVASLLAFSRDIDPKTAEDIVQDSFFAALKDWKNKSVPLNPAGWLYQVCKRKALNKIQKKGRTIEFSENMDYRVTENGISESVLTDQQLKLLFACAHPDLAPKTQVVVILKYVANLKVLAIAQNLGMTVDGVDKLLLRARQKIKDEKILLEEPKVHALQTRLPSVHKVIYLIFNEGYKSSWGNEILREELCSEALVMNHILLNSLLGNKETTALHALMLFNSARFKSRFGLRENLLTLKTRTAGCGTAN